MDRGYVVGELDSCVRLAVALVRAETGKLQLHLSSRLLLSCPRYPYLSNNITTRHHTDKSLWIFSVIYPR